MDNYEVLLDDCKQIITEYSFTSRWSIIEMYWKLGERLSQEKSLSSDSIAKMARDLQKPVRTFQRAVQFYGRYPDLNMLPEGKNTSWHQIVNKYLPETSSKKEGVKKCPICGGRMDSECHGK